MFSRRKNSCVFGFEKCDWLTDASSADDVQTDMVHTNPSVIFGLPCCSLCSTTKVAASWPTMDHCHLGWLVVHSRGKPKDHSNYSLRVNRINRLKNWYRSKKGESISHHATVCTKQWPRQKCHFRRVLSFWIHLVLLLASAAVFRFFDYYFFLLY